MPARPPRPAMGIATPTSYQNKLRYQTYLQAYRSADPNDWQDAIREYFDPEAVIDISHPLNRLTGAEGYLDGFIRPLQDSFRGLQRQDQIICGGEYQGGEWVTSMGYFYGHFCAPLLGIPASQKMAVVRYGEFLRIEQGRVVEAQCFVGLAELIIALHLWPLAPSTGYEGVYPAPASHDGTQIRDNDPAESRATADWIEAMLMELTSPDAAWAPYWDPRMVWYGPGGFGSYSTVDAFKAFQMPFEKAFKGWGDGSQEGITGVGSKCKAGDGQYAFLNGWPQITGIHVGRFMGIGKTGKRVYMRDCDWWRMQDGKILENWCMVDTLDLAMQMDVDVLDLISQR